MSPRSAAGVGAVALALLRGGSSWAGSEEQPQSRDKELSLTTPAGRNLLQTKGVQVFLSASNAFCVGFMSFPPRPDKSTRILVGSKEMMKKPNSSGRAAKCPQGAEPKPHTTDKQAVGLRGRHCNVRMLRTGRITEPIIFDK